MAPPGWRTWLLIQKAWSEALGRTGNQRGLWMSRLLPRAGTAAQRNLILATLANFWDAGAEEAVAGFLNDRELRLNAARALLDNTGMKYHEKVCNLAGDPTIARSERHFLFMALVSGPHGTASRRAGVDRKLVNLGIALMEEEALQKTAGGYFTAGLVGEYVGVKNGFTPDLYDPRYRDATGLNEEYFTQTVENARSWWERCKGEYQEK